MLLSSLAPSSYLGPNIFSALLYLFCFFRVGDLSLVEKEQSLSWSFLECEYSKSPHIQNNYQYNILGYFTEPMIVKIL
jgi:hypothetical protein